MNEEHTFKSINITLLTEMWASGMWQILKNVRGGNYHVIGSEQIE